MSQVGQVEKGGIEKGSVNGHHLVQFAAKTFAGEIVADKLDPDPEPDLAAELRKPPNPAPTPPSKPCDLENRLIAVLAPHDYHGGLSYGEFRRQAQLPDEVFDQTLKRLCRRGGPVYKSALNNRYQLSPRFAKILAGQKASGNGSTQPSQRRNAFE